MVKQILIIAILTILTGCSDLQAYVPGLETSTASPTAVKPASTPIKTKSPVTTQPPAKPVWRVCTGVDQGALNLRTGPGTGYASIAILEEGIMVRSTNVKLGHWAMIITTSDPEIQGWVNASYLCQGVIK